MVAEPIGADEAGAIEDIQGIADVLKEVPRHHKAPVHVRMGIHRPLLVLHQIVAIDVIVEELPMRLARPEAVGG